MAKSSKTIGSIITSLATLPTELAHQIIDDLQVKDVLKLMCYDNDRVDDCIQSHPVCSAMFGFAAGPDTITKIKFAAQFYIDFFREVSPALDSKGWLKPHRLQLNIHCVEPKDYNKITVEMREAIHFELCHHWNKTDLTQFGAPDYPEPVNYPYCLPPDHSSFEDLKERWEAIKKAKAKLFQQRSSELSFAADILEANPDILKRTLDPHQVRRPNTAHMVSRLRCIADKILRAPGQRFVRSEHFSYEFFVVTPFDSVLADLLYMMGKYGILVGEKLMVDTAIDSDLAASHPASILKSARILVNGLSHFEVSRLGTPKERAAMKHSTIANPEGMFPRTGNTTWSEGQKLMHGVDVEGPYFTPHKIGSNLAFRRPDFCQWYPHDEGEKEWLGAFVEVYRYLKDLEIVALREQS
jgi:hypothetical protein